MRMSALLFALIGLAVGLYLGFNPVAHRDLVRWWNRETANQVDGRTHDAFSIRQWNSQLNRSLQSSPKPLVQTGAQRSTVPTLTQIGDELHAFWLALEHVWLSFLAQLHMR